MGVTDSLRRVAFARPHLLLLTAPGATEVRIAVERFARQRGWPLADSPADADVLVEAGVLHGGLAEVAELVERQMPTPSMRMPLASVPEVGPGLAVLPDRLASWRPSAGEATGSWSELPMADRAEDRDGLKLDVLRVPLGPLLPHWPAGLRLVAELQGDVIRHAEVEVLGMSPGTRSFWASGDRLVARRLDALARLLGVAGWTAMALRCQAMRDRVLTGAPPDRVVREFEVVAGRVRRSRLLRSMLTDLGPVAGVGDAADRLDRWLTETATGLVVDPDASANSHPRRPSSAEWLDMLPGLVSGAELAAARLIVASVDIDIADLAERVSAGANHG
jgi:hypothetical protein